MRPIKMFFKVCIAIFFVVSSVSAAEEEFDSEQMLSDLKEQLELSSEKLSQLKPTIDTKSAELKKIIHGAVDKGFVELEELTDKLDGVSKDAEKKVREFLSGEEMAKLKAYLNRIDEEAIKEVKDRLVAELSAILELTEEQVVKLKPILEDSFTQLSQMLDVLAKEGSKSWGEFLRQYEELSTELREKLQETLDAEQMKKLDKYNEEKKDKIQMAFFSA